MLSEAKPYKGKTISRLSADWHLLLPLTLFGCFWPIYTVGLVHLICEMCRWAKMTSKALCRIWKSSVYSFSFILLWNSLKLLEYIYVYWSMYFLQHCMKDSNIGCKYTKNNQIWNQTIIRKREVSKSIICRIKELFLVSWTGKLSAVLFPRVPEIEWKMQCPWRASACRLMGS